MGNRIHVETRVKIEIKTQILKKIKTLNQMKGFKKIPGSRKLRQKNLLGNQLLRNQLNRQVAMLSLYLHLRQVR